MSIQVPEGVTPLLGCLPADPKEWEKAGFVHIDIPKSYTLTTCQKCGKEVYIGPKQREFCKERPDVMIECFICMLKVIKAAGIAGLASLNNEESCKFFRKDGRILSKPNPNN